MTSLRFLTIFYRGTDCPGSFYYYTPPTLPPSLLFPFLIPSFPLLYPVLLYYLLLYFHLQEQGWTFKRKENGLLASFDKVDVCLSEKFTFYSPIPSPFHISKGQTRVGRGLPAGGLNLPSCLLANYCSLPSAKRLPNVPLRWRVCSGQLSHHPSMLGTTWRLRKGGYIPVSTSEGSLLVISSLFVQRPPPNESLPTNSSPPAGPRGLPNV